MCAAVVQRLDLDIERSEMAVAVLIFDARIGELDVAVVVWKLVVDGPTMKLLRRSIGSAVAVRLAAIALLQELLVLALQLVIKDDTSDERAVFAQPFCVLEGRAIDLGVVHQLARTMDGKASVSDASDTDVELLPALRFLRSTALVVHMTMVSELPLHSSPLQLFTVHTGPPVGTPERLVLAR